VSRSPQADGETDRPRAKQAADLTIAIARVQTVSEYMLQKQIFVSKCEGGVVVLDLYNDAYFCMSTRDACCLTSVVEGWPLVDALSGAALDCSQDEARQLVESMLGRNLITLDKSEGKPAVPPTMPAPRERLIPAPDLYARRSDVSHWRIIRHVPRFLWSVIAAAATLRWFGLRYTVERMERRRPPRTDAFNQVDIERMRVLLTIFNEIRPFCYRSAQACLLHSLSLLTFLSAYGLYPIWVFGVQAKPFQAHCWVQHGYFILNDSVEHAGSYVPIMTV
jgi:hypothetical protein